MNIQTVHVILLIVGALTMGSQFVSQNFPQYAAMAGLAIQMLASVSAVLGVLSPSAANSTPAPATLQAAVKASANAAPATVLSAVAAQTAPEAAALQATVAK